MDNDARRCPTCGYIMTSKGGIKNVRTNEDGYYVRYRTCHKCGVVYKTYEIHEEQFNQMNGIYSAIKSILDAGVVERQTQQT